MILSTVLYLLHIILYSYYILHKVLQKFLLGKPSRNVSWILLDAQRTVKTLKATLRLGYYIIIIIMQEDISHLKFCIDSNCVSVDTFRQLTWTHLPTLVQVVDGEAALVAVAETKPVCPTYYYYY